MERANSRGLKVRAARLCIKHQSTFVVCRIANGHLAPEASCSEAHNETMIHISQKLPSL